MVGACDKNENAVTGKTGDMSGMPSPWGKFL